jgi:CubicO group peptidase (beta-lactamase class C family)
MEETGSVEGWPEELSRLDRHGSSGQRTPDTAGLQDLMETYRIPGVSIAAARLDGGMWCSGYGTTGGSGRRNPVSPHTVFQACSISKHVTAFGALRLVADGILVLDADIGGYLAAWQLPAGGGGWRPRVTLRQLLAHTAGLSYNWFRGYDTGEPAPSLLQTLRGEAPANTPPVRPSLLPGSRFRYSGSHYAVLQQLMAEVTATPFGELMRALVLVPAGMSDSSFSQQFPHQRPGGVALGHHVTGTPVPGGWRVLPEMAGAGLWTTPADLTRLELEIARAAAGQSRVLGRDLAGQMLTPQVPGGMGLGTEIDTSAGYLRFGHTGGNVGYSCFSFAWPATGAAVAVMANSEGAPEVLGAILAAAGRRHGPPPEPATPPAPDDLTGRYLLREDYPVDIAADGTRLTLTAAGQHPAELLPLPGGRYRLPQLDCEITFGHAGGLPVMHIRQEGTTQTATRSPSPRPG